MLPVNVGLAVGAAPTTSATEICPSANSALSDIKFAKTLALLIVANPSYVIFLVHP
jgi:hypothetical protein